MGDGGRQPPDLVPDLMWRDLVAGSGTELDRCSDDDLVRLACQGTPQAFEALWRRHDPWIRAYVRRFAASDEDAEDLVQDVALKIHRALTGYRAPSRFVRWAARIARNAAIDGIRGRSVRQCLRAVVPGFPDQGIPDTRYGPEPLFDSEHLSKELQQSLNTLPRDLRIVVILRYFRRLSTEETARELECPEGTVKSRLHDALRRLRACIERTSPD